MQNKKAFFKNKYKYQIATKNDILESILIFKNIKVKTYHCKAKNLSIKQYFK